MCVQRSTALSTKNGVQRGIRAEARRRVGEGGAAIAVLSRRTSRNSMDGGGLDGDGRNARVLPKELAVFIKTLKSALKRATFQSSHDFGERTVALRNS